MNEAPLCSICQLPGPAEPRLLMGATEPVCGKCYMAWYEAGPPPTVETILRHRLQQEVKEEE